MSIQRAPTLHRLVDPVAEAILPRVDNPDPSLPAPAPSPEPLNTSLQVRVRASTRERLDEAVRKLQYERKDRSVSLGQPHRSRARRLADDTGPLTRGQAEQLAAALLDAARAAAIAAELDGVVRRKKL